jgi:hypothetical protein
MFVFVTAGQARRINMYNSLKSKVSKCCAIIFFNKNCQTQDLTPRYANIKVPNASPAAIHTKRKLAKSRLKDKVKFLYLRKCQLNKQLYKIHLEKKPSM